MKSKLTPKQKADRKYHAKVIHKRVVFNVDNELEQQLLSAFNASGLEFSPLCKKLLSAHFNIK